VSIEEINLVTDTLLKRYGTLDYIFSLEIAEAMEQIYTAIQQDNEEKMLLRWITGGYERIMSFTDFKEKLNTYTDNNQTFDARTETEILEDVRNILNGCKLNTEVNKA